MTATKFNLSIIIVTWNTAKITYECVTSINKYLRNISYEIIVVDNNSTDNTQQLLSKLNYLKYVRNPDNLGFSKANNIGFSHSTGKLLLFLNSDMLLIDNSLELLLDHYLNNPEVGIIGPQLLNPDLSPQASVFPDQSIPNAFKEFWLKQPLSFSKYTPKSDSPKSVWAISGGAVLISKQLFTQIGRWNELYFLYYEDLDLCRTVRAIGKEIIYFPKCKIIHHHGSSGKTIVDSTNQWRRLIPGSIIYHGRIKHHILIFILWIGQKWLK